MLGEKLGEKIGIVSASEVIAVGPQHKILVEIPFDVYKSRLLKVGELLLIETAVHKSLILARITSIQRRHLVALLGIEPMDTYINNPQGLTTPALLELEPIAECPSLENCDPTQPASPVDPTSAVYAPSPEVIAIMLGIPQHGALLGKLYVSKELDIYVRLPKEALFTHMLVVGTTGAGKTTFLKNLAISAYWDLGVIPLAFDIQGDFIHLVYPAPDSIYKPLDKLTIIWPVTQSFLFRENKELIRYANEYLEKIEQEGDLSVINDPKLFAEAVSYGLGQLFLRRAGISGDVVPEAEEKNGVGYVKGFTVYLSNAEIDVVTWALNLRDVIFDVPSLFPFFGTQRIALLYKDIASLLVEKIGEGDPNNLTIRVAVEKINKLEGQIKEKLKLHSSQIESIIRGFFMLKGTDILDVEWCLSKTNKPCIKIGEPNYDTVFENPAVVYLELFMEKPTAASIVVYRLLRKLMEIKDRELRTGTPKPMLVLVDEAHEYFPQTERGENVSKEAVEDMINKLTRLGRVRRVGVAFATHMPEDLNPLVTQLSNTKVVFRSDETVLESFGLREYSQLLRIAPNGVAIAKSYAFRTGVLAFRTLPPQTFHRSHVD